MARREAIKTITKGYALLVIGSLWYLLQEGILDLGKAFALFLVLIGAFLMIRGSIEVRGNESERGSS